MMEGVKLMHYPKFLMLLGCVWQLPHFESHKIQKLYYCLGYAVQVFFFAVTLCQWIEFFCLLGGNGDVADVKKLTDNLRIAASAILVGVKLLIFQKRKFTDILIQVIKEEENIITKSKDDEELRTLHLSVAKYVGKFSAILLWGTYSTALFSVGATYLTGMLQSNNNIKMEKPMIVSAHLPFDQNEHYGAALLVQAAWICMAAGYFCMDQAIYISVMAFVRMQLQILQQTIRNFGFCEQSDGPSAAEELEMMKMIIRFHQYMIRFVKQLNEMIKFMILAEFLISSINVAAAAFLLMAGQTTNDMAFSIGCVILIIGQLFITVWHANAVSVESVNVSAALYEFPWYEKSVEMQRIVHLMILRSQRPLTLTVGPFKPLTNQVILQVINGAYSYITIMTRNY